MSEQKERMREAVANLIAASQAKIVKLPAGKALGADDLTTWAHRRATGRSGVPTEKKLWLRCEVCRTTFPAKVASSIKADLFRFCARCGKQRSMRPVRPRLIEDRGFGAVGHVAAYIRW